MVAQTEILVLCLSVFIFRVTCPVTPTTSPTRGITGSPTRSGSPNRPPKRSPSRTLSRTSSRYGWIYPSRMWVNPKLWRSPSYQETPDGDPLCNPAYVAAKFPSASDYCKAECAALSAQAELIFKTYGEQEGLAKTNSRQCSNFVNKGVCTNYLGDRVSFCWCLGRDYSQLAIVCRAFIEGSRNLVNARMAALNFWELNVRPTLPDLPPLPTIPGWPRLPRLPSLPSRSSLPGLPSCNSVPNLPGAGLVRSGIEWWRGRNVKPERRSPGRHEPKTINIAEG